MKHLIETTDLNSLGFAEYDRLILDSTKNEIVYRGGVNTNGHSYVDLGLPSGTLWATMNVGATSETDYGDYFMWGSTTPNTNTTCDWANAPFNNGLDSYNEEYFNAHKSEWLDDKNNLKPEFDAATQIMGGDWRMPTKAEFDELISNTTTGWIEDFNGSGVNCIKFTSKTNGKSIFFPASGYRRHSSLDFHGYGAYVWSSSLNPSPGGAYSISFESADVSYSTDLRYYGFVVRGVCE